MICSTARQQLALLVRNDLAPTDAASVRGHLATCLDCCRHFTELQSAMDALDAFRSDALDASPRSILPKLHFALASRVAREPAESRWRAAFRNTLVPCMAGLALFLMGIQLPDYVSEQQSVLPLDKQAAAVGHRVDFGGLPPNLVPVYLEPSWRSLERLDRPSNGREPLRNVSY